MGGWATRLGTDAHSLATGLSWRSITESSRRTFSAWSGYRTIHESQHTDPYPALAGIIRSWVGLAPRQGGPHLFSTQYGVSFGLFLRVLPEHVRRFLYAPNLPNHSWPTNKSVQQI
jgi:hypothetical protein